MKTIPLIIVLCLLVSGCNTSVSEDRPDVSTNIKFVNISADRGFKFKHKAALSKEKWMPEILGSGVAIADFNNDGSPDIYMANGGAIGSAKRPQDSLDRLFINDGTGKFSDRSAEWMVSGSGYGQGVTAGDIDNDGNIDLFLTSYEGDNRLLRNTGSKFEDITKSAGIEIDGKWATSAGFGDFDSDGDLDLFVVKYVVYDEKSRKKTYRNRTLIYSAPFLYEGVADQLLRNEGDGTFKDVSIESGIGKSAQKGLALAVGDIDLDGDTDIYVANDSTPNQLWLNDGNGKFEDVARLTGSAYSEIGGEDGSMGADFSDVDKNGLLDITVTNFETEATSLYLQTEKLLFRETSDAAGIGRSTRSKLSFGVEFFDADNDGDEDLLVANGHIDDTIESHSETIKFKQKNTLFENKGNGRFVDITDTSGNALMSLEVSRGLAVADFDNDGDLDFLIANNNGDAQLALNETSAKGNFAGFLLQGSDSNRNAIGARLKILVGNNAYERQVMGSQSYLSLSDFRVLFGLGASEKIDQLTISWPAGSVQVFKDLPAGFYYRIKEGSRPTKLF